MVKKAVKFWGSMGFAATVLSSMVAVSGQGIAQNLRPPAELPLQSFTSEQYVDSTGCAFIRTGQGASTDWIPRISRDRRQICGLPPSLSQMAAAPVAPAPVVGAAPVTRPARAPCACGNPLVWHPLQHLSWRLFRPCQARQIIPIAALFAPAMAA